LKPGKEEIKKRDGGNSGDKNGAISMDEIHKDKD